MANIKLSKVYLQRFSAVEDGMHLEIYKADPSGKSASGEPYPIVTIRADASDDLQLGILLDGDTVSIPLSEIERALAVAKEKVHSEEFYD